MVTRCDVSQPARGWEVTSYAALSGETGPQWLRKRCGGKTCRRVARVAFPTVQTVQPQTMACCLENGEFCCGGLLAGSERRSEPVGHTHTFLQGAGGVCPLHNTPGLMQGPAETFVRIECQREVVWDTRANSPATQIQYAATCF